MTETLTDISISYGQAWLEWAKDKLFSVEEEQVQALIDRGPQYAGRLHETMDVYRKVHAFPVSKSVAESVIMAALYGCDERRRAQWAGNTTVIELLERVASIKH